MPVPFFKHQPVYGALLSARVFLNVLTLFWYDKNMENLTENNPSSEFLDVEVGAFKNENIEEIKEFLTLAYMVNGKNQGPTSTPYFPKDYEKRVQDKNVRLFVAKVDQKIAGSVQYEDHNNNGTAYLSQMASLPDYRSQGIGVKLLKAAEESARQEGFTKIRLKAMNEKGLPAYYKKQGYMEVDTIKRRTYTLTVMEKNL